MICLKQIALVVMYLCFLKVWELKQESIHGRFMLYDKSNNDTDEHVDDWNFVIGAGFYNECGSYLGRGHEGVVFENTTFDIKEAIHRYNDMNNQYREIYFDKIKEE